MIARASKLFLPTLREDPADADAASHKLLVRGGFIRQVGAGVWTYLPLGWRVHEKVVQIIREEMDAIGGQEMLMPVLTPAELWEASGRIGIPELFKLKDRAGRDLVLPLTHEETVTFHARELHSYKQLPQILYHFSLKFRDEARPRAGLIRVREFIMKDAYSFDRDEAGLDESFRKHSEAYKRIFERCGLDTQEVAAESGIMGGSGSQDFLAPAGVGGEHARDLRERRLRGRPRDRRRRSLGSRLPRRTGDARGGRDPGPAHDRGGLGVPGRRRARHGQSDARRHRRRARARPRPRRRPAQRDEASGCPRPHIPACTAGGDPGGLRRRRRVDRPGGRAGRRGGRRDAARGPVRGRCQPR